MRFVGIDPGASAIHCVVLDASRRMVDGHVLPAEASRDLLEVAAGATAIAIDAPAALSTHHTLTTRRCHPNSARRAAARSRSAASTDCGFPGVTPVAGAAVPGWMRVGFRLYAQLAANGHTPIEVFPHAGFRLLAGRVVPKKTTMAGVRERIAVLEGEDVTAP
jgi:predicted nuclease with RNAse H fold